jgi:Raf kinase inhibitor-like YbhB/YbcL family protein
MSVTSPNFKGGLIPAEFTCYGQGGGVSPPIFWSGAPPGTKSIAVVVDDAAAPISPKVYWIVFDISPSTTDLQTGALPPHARTAYNTAGTDTYDAPCPRGSAHSYRFTVYALNTFFGSALPGHPQLLPAWTAIAQHVIARGTMTSHAVPGRRPLPQLSPGHSAETIGSSLPSLFAPATSLSNQRLADSRHTRVKFPNCVTRRIASDTITVQADQPLH